MTAPKTTTIGPLGRRVARVLERAGLRVDGGFDGRTQPGAPGGTGFDGPVRAVLAEVRDAESGRWLFAVGLRETDFNVRAGINRPGETIADSWPYDDGGHVDGRCFMFCHGDETRTEAFLQALDREVARHRPAEQDDADRLAQALSEALPDADEATLSAMAKALAAGLDHQRIAEMAGRVSDIGSTPRGAAPGP